MLTAAKIVMLVFAAIAILAIVGAGLMLSESQQPPKQQEQNAQQPDAEHGNASPSANQASEKESNNWRYYKEAIKEKWQRFIHFADENDKAIVAIGTTFIAIFTIVLAFATFFLWLSTKDLVIDAKLTSERQLRAYMVVPNVTLDCPSCIKAVGKPKSDPIDMSALNRIVIYLQNVGETPAYNVGVFPSFHSTRRGEGLPVNFSYPDKTRELNPRAVAHGSRPTIGKNQLPGHQITLNESEVIEVLKAMSGETEFFVYGHVDYVDIFGKQRQTPFCFIHDPKPDSGLSPFVIYKEHNTPSDYQNRSEQ